MYSTRIVLKYFTTKYIAFNFYPNSIMTAFIEHCYNRTLNNHETKGYFSGA